MARQVDTNAIKTARLDCLVMSTRNSATADRYWKSVDEQRKIDSFFSRLSRSYPRCATVHLARPPRSIPRFRSEWQRLNVIAPVQVWKEVIAPFTVAQKCLIDIVRGKLIVQTSEASKVVYRTLGRVF